MKTAILLFALALAAPILGHIFLAIKSGRYSENRSAKIICAREEGRANCASSELRGGPSQRDEFGVIKTAEPTRLLIGRYRGQSRRRLDAAEMAFMTQQRHRPPVHVAVAKLISTPTKVPV
jgi:hypothetical protein